MKKLLVLFAALMLVACYDAEDPLKYKGCVVVKKYDNSYDCGNLYLKLTPELRKQYKRDYLTIGVPKWELDKLNVGDTIK